MMSTKHKISRYKLDAASLNLKECDYLANNDDIIEVSLWNNGEGFDVHLNCKHGERSITMTWGEFKALKKLVKELSG